MKLRETESLKSMAFCDLDREISATRRVLERLPEEHFSWKPHEKSMSLSRLAMHVVNLLQWYLDTLAKDEFDVSAAPPPMGEPASRSELLAAFEKNATAVEQALARTDDASLARTWTLRSGPQVLYQQPRVAILRVSCLNHLIHHRAQLCIYLRLLHVPVPAVYFNSADEPEWKFD